MIKIAIHVKAFNYIAIIVIVIIIKIIIIL